jgi:hypothetical protein
MALSCALATTAEPRPPAWRGIAIVGVALLLSAGCGGNRPSTATVRGTVELDGRLLNGFDHGGVVFTPKGGRMAKGVIETDGSFQLSSFGRGDGAIIGTAHVTVSATVDDPEAKTVDRGVGVRWIIPAKFSGDDSGLQCEVLPGQENVYRIKLSSDGTGEIEVQGAE